jgi:UDP-glucose:(heptosyl)LPS alpha-1,3-glucosyltransferase
MQSPIATERGTQRSASPCDVTIVANDIGSVGGMELVLAELVMGLRDLGHAVTVIARTFEVPDRDGVVFHRVPGPSRPFLLAYPWFVLAGSLAVWRWRRGVVQVTGAVVFNRADVIHVHYCHQVGPANPSRSTPLLRAQAKIVGLVKRLSERACFRANSHASFVCVSDGVAAEVREHYPELVDRVITIHNGVDTDRFMPGRRVAEASALRARLEIPDGQLVAAFVGSEWERKGLGPLIQALALAPGWCVVVAGGGDRQRYQELAEALGVAHAVRWLGVVPDVQPVYELADAFVLPSSYETFSLVSFEAAASGLPVLATPVNGVRELIRDGHNGFVISREAAQIAERLRALTADPVLRRELGENARSSALQFSWQEMVARHQQLYAQLSRDSRV